MSDCYRWIDPFDEIEAFKRAAAYSYSEGQRSILRRIEGDAARSFSESLTMSCGVMADRIARDVVIPLAAREFWSLGEFNSVSDRIKTAIEKHVGPVLEGIERNSELEIQPQYANATSVSDAAFTVKFETVRPFRYAQKFVTGYS